MFTDNSEFCSSSDELSTCEQPENALDLTTNSTEASLADNFILDELLKTELDIIPPDKNNINNNIIVNKKKQKMNKINKVCYWFKCLGLYM